ncbi:hypothetical protein EXU85_11710 [Spirosoma sp. KCTC 42546]|uniref:DUF6169 family protein n=1 Tax=Spirosoma sp. KCTC 42546 TaxID=2520506 RepID=UPI001159B18B|nr:DUF6169 family protein [Spirosoma sp. KCTC 42546]QDK79235.1 hypothetical protein EXU85_11710 [Spirosoma sp. KCTC 42546]
MPNDAPVNSYEFRFFGGEQNSYFFTTRQEIIYQIKFVPSAYLFVDYIDGHVNAFEMVIAVADNPTGGRIAYDPLTEDTIRAIFTDFFCSLDHVIVYICDSSDGREQARFRKFTSWYYKDMDAMPADLFKMDAYLPDGDRTTILSGILSTRHPYFSQFVELFKNLSEADKY